MGQVAAAADRATGVAAIGLQRRFAAAASYFHPVLELVAAAVASCKAIAAADFGLAATRCSDASGATAG